MIFLADVKFILSPKSTVGIVGNEVKLSCEARGQSVKAIEWTVGDNKVSSSDLVYGFSSQETANGRRSTLTIKQLKLSDGSLQYFCTAGTTMSPGLLASSAATIHGVLSAQHILCSLFLFIILSPVLGTITGFKDKAYSLGETSQEPFSCLFTAKPMPNAALQLDNVNATVGPPVKTEDMNEYKISLPITSLNAATAGVYHCVVEFPGSSLHLNHRAQLQGDQLMMLVFGMLCCV